MTTAQPWYIGRDGKQLGPYRYDSLRRVAENGKLRADDLLWTEGMPGWSRADQVPDFAPWVAKAAPTPTVAAPAPSIPQATKPVSHSNYLLRHWCGEFSLGHAYWINSVAVAGVLTGIFYLIGEGDITKHFDIRMAGWWALGIIALSFLTGLWSSIGVWRSADAHVARGGTSGWAGAAKVVVVLGLLRLVGSAFQSIPMVEQSVSLAFGHDTMPASQLRVLDRATEVEIGGGISFGTANALATILDATPTIRLVQLNNVGGWIDEGLKLGELVEARKLATYTARECDSACLLVFMAGTDRYLGSKGKLGFHQASVAGQGGPDAESGTQAFRDALARRGVPQEFISHALSTPPSGMWYPTHEELLAAHVITAVVNEDKFGSGGVSGWQDRAKLERTFDGIPLFAAVAKADPQRYQALKENYISGIQSGQPLSEMSAQVHKVVVETILPTYLANGQSAELIAYWRTQVKEMQELRTPDGGNCLAFMFPTAEDTARLQNLISESTRSADLERLAALLEAPLGKGAAPSEAEVTPALTEAARRTEKLQPGALKLIAAANRATPRPAALCDASIAFYSMILKLPPEESAAVLKFLVAQK